MRKLSSALLMVLFFSQFLNAHHGPGVRGYDLEKRVVISGLIEKCIKCSGGDHGFLQVSVGSVTWAVTLPSNKVLKKAKLSLDRLKPKRTVDVTGFAHKSKANDIYPDQIVVNGVTILTNGSQLPIG
jgi:hypothetical protein